jgi:hypothetical protein
MLSGAYQQSEPREKRYSAERNALATATKLLSSTRNGDDHPLTQREELGSISFLETRWREIQGL